MTAPPLPPCPVCGYEPDVIPATRLRPARRSCWGQDEFFNVTHDITAYGLTDAEADERWRRVAGGRK